MSANYQLLTEAYHCIKFNTTPDSKMDLGRAIFNRLMADNRFNDGSFSFHLHDNPRVILWEPEEVNHLKTIFNLDFIEMKNLFAGIGYSSYDAWDWDINNPNNNLLEMFCTRMESFFHFNGQSLTGLATPEENSNTVSDTDFINSLRVS